MTGRLPFQLFRGSRVRAVAAIAVVVALAASGSAVDQRPTDASIASDKVKIAQLKDRLEAQGEHVKSLVSSYNKAASNLHQLNVQISVDRAQLAADDRSETAAIAALQRVAVRAYVTGGGDMDAALALFSGTTSIADAATQTTYLSAVHSSLRTALAKVRDAHVRTQEDASNLSAKQAQAKRTLHELADARRATLAAVKSDEALLQHVNADLAALVVVAAQEAEQRDAERKLAAMPLVPTAAAVPPMPIPKPTPGTYANPLRAIKNLVPERIDQGVDFAGIGPIYAIGDGVVLSTSIPGWPGGTYIAYQLIDGPATGLVVYAAEDIAPMVQIGDRVTANTILGLMYPGPDGIETGWGDGVRIGNTMARTYRQYSGGNSTAFGTNFSQLLFSIGAPAGVPQNDPPTGALPAGWPSW
jgi:murein DD-endopeptidase MepM/ murein hydrolase activator NlpD